MNLAAMMRMRTLAGMLAVVGLAGCQTLPAADTSLAKGATQTASVRVLPQRVPPVRAVAERAALIEKTLERWTTIPAEPILRIDMGAHIRAIHALAVSPQSRQVATASVDRTVRIWDTASGELNETLRPPMSSDGLGTLRALAFSPDGKVLAAGGLTFFARRPASLEQAEFSLYFFDPVSGAINRTVDDVPGQVMSLAWSANGRWLAVAHAAAALPELGGQRIIGRSGVRIYDAKSFAVLKEIVTDAPCDWLEFDGTQRLFATCRSVLLSFDERGPLRLRNAPHDAPFRHAALAPDGRTLAVAHSGQGRLELLSGDDLSLLHEIRLTADDAAHHGDLVPVWSPGGAFLYAAGRRLSANTHENVVFKWDRQGRGEAKRLPAGRIDVFDLRALRDGRLLLAASDGDLDVLDLQDRIVDLAVDRTIDSDNRPGALWVSADGRNVAYSDDDEGRQRYVYSHEQRILRPWDEYKDHARAPLLAPLTQGGIELSHWQNSQRLLCNGTPIELDETVAQNLAMLKNGSGFAIGTNNGVIFFDSVCRRVWENRTQARTLAINIAEEAGFVIAQDEAGVIRWLRLNDGEKQLSIFTSRSGRSWAAWTPEGFYDASPEGEKLVGWHLNRDRRRAADFYPASRFRDLYYDPREVSFALHPTGADHARSADIRAARLAEIRRRMQLTLPPQITLLSVQEILEASGPVARLTYRLRTPSGEPVQRVRVLINGRPSGQVQAFAATPPTAGSEDEAPRQLSVPLPTGEVEIGLIAEGHGTVSDLERVRLSGQATASLAGDASGIKPRLYALVVGVGAYTHESIPRLDFPAKDARDFAATLKKQHGRLYRSVEVRLLEDAAATRERVIDGLDWLRRQVTANDLAVVFFAGHGVNDTANRYYFVPVNADPLRLRSTGIPNDDISEALQALPAKVLAFLDTCHAGNVLGSGKQRNLAIGGHGDINRLVNELTSAENGVVVFASSTGRETSQESAEWNNGVFTKSLVEGLAGQADFNRDNAVSLNELNLYVAERVKQLTNGDQHANMIRPDSIRDFPFAIMK
jgi:WD40 repeat protein